MINININKIVQKISTLSFIKLKVNYFIDDNTKMNIVPQEYDINILHIYDDVSHRQNPHCHTMFLSNTKIWLHYVRMKPVTWH